MSARSRWTQTPSLAFWRPIDGLEARLTRNGYNVKLLTEMIAARPKDIRSFLSGRLPPERTQELHDQLLAAGVPL